MSFLPQEKMNEGATLMLLANKLDMEETRKVSIEEGQALAEVKIHDTFEYTKYFLH